MYPGAALLAALVLLISFESGLCVKCYQCTSTNNPSCKDPFNNPKAVPTYDCGANEITNFYNGFLSSFMSAPQTINAPKYCLKMTLAGSLGDTIVRTCVEGPSSNPNKTCSELERSLPNQYASSVAKQSLTACNVCEGEVCNGAHSTAASVGLASLVAGIVAFLAY